MIQTEILKKKGRKSVHWNMRMGDDLWQRIYTKIKGEVKNINLWINTVSRPMDGSPVGREGRQISFHNTYWLIEGY